MKQTEDVSQGYLEQCRGQLEAVRQPLDRLIQWWGLNSGSAAIATTLYRHHELHVFSRACEESARLFWKVRPIFPGSLSQHDVVVEHAEALPGTPPVPPVTASSHYPEQGDSVQLHPVSPELFYGTFQKPPKYSVESDAHAKHMVVLARGSINELSHYFVSSLLHTREACPEVYNQLQGVDLIYLDRNLGEKHRQQIIAQACHALEKSSSYHIPAVTVHAVAENQAPAVYFLCANAWAAWVSDPALAIDVLNAGTPCLALRPLNPAASYADTPIDAHLHVASAQPVSACLDDPASRAALISTQRTLLLQQALAMTTQTTVHSHFQSLAFTLCDELEQRHIVDAEKLQQMREQLLVQAQGAFWPSIATGSETFQHRLQVRRRRMTRKWRKLRSSPRQFARDSRVLNRPWQNRQ